MIETREHCGFERFDAEAFIIRMLGVHGDRVYAGPTTSEQRKERIRTAIREGNLAEIVIGTRRGKSETFAACFERFYGESLGDDEC
jgi:hypothetical protein